LALVWQASCVMVRWVKLGYVRAWYGSLGMVCFVPVWLALVWQASCVMVRWVKLRYVRAWYGSLGKVSLGQVGHGMAV